MKQVEIHRLKNNWEYAQKLFNHVQKTNLPGWKLTCDNMTDKIGVCDYNTKIITLSTVFMRGANCNYAKVKKALMHEIAHALTPGHSHNDVWKNVCKNIGGDTRLAASMNLPAMNWSVYCKNCKWRQEYSTKPMMENKVCNVCYEKPRVKYIK